MSVVGTDIELWCCLTPVDDGCGGWEKGSDLENKVWDSLFTMNYIHILLT